MVPTPVMIREASALDAAVLARIYNHYIATSTVTFDTQVKTAEERQEWLASHGPAHPVIVATIDGQVVGFGALSPWGSRPAWHRTVEVSSYVAEEWRGRGVGRALMEELVERALDAGHHALVGQIVADNVASLKLANQMGFAEVGRLREVGDKFGMWHDVVLVERLL